ncbi:hypothetical protein R1flu_021366 [Riccia fluitans]|uniref:Uncharacterized protein n=1 Tax=Riccia fluitans TaxID=41844 RepID=A0ABD1ZPD8_9MARC
MNNNRILVSTFQLLSFSALVQIAAAAATRNSGTSNLLPDPVAFTEKIVEEDQPRSWDALSRCIKDSKEERVLERWMSCVEAVTSLESVRDLPPDGESKVIQPRNEASKADGELSNFDEKLKAHGLVNLDNSEFSEQKERDSSQLQEARGGGDGGLGIMKMEVLPHNKVMSSLAGVDQRVSDSEEKGNNQRGFVSGTEMQKQENVQNDGPTSVGTEAVEQVSADSRNREGRDVLQENIEKVIPGADCGTETLNSCNSGFVTSQEGRIAEDQNNSSKCEGEPFASLTTKEAVTSVTIVGLLTLLLRAKRGLGVLKSDNVPNISTSSCSVASSELHSEPTSALDTQKLSDPLGMAVAQVLYEVLEQNGNHTESTLSAEILSNLLESALKESLTPVLGDGRFQFVEKFRDSFSSTYRTRATVRSVFKRAGMSHNTEAREGCGRSWKSTQLRTRRESHKEQYYVDNVESHTNVLDVTNRSTKLTHRSRTVPVKDEKRRAHLPSFGGETNSFLSTGRHEQVGNRDSVDSSIGQDSCRNSYETPEVGPSAPFVEEASSQDEQMYSADDSSRSEEWILLKGSGSNTEALRRKEVSVGDESDCCHSLEPDQSNDQTCTIHEVVHEVPVSEHPEPSGGLAAVVGSSEENDCLTRMLSTIEKLMPPEELSDLVNLDPWVDNSSAASVKEDTKLPFKEVTPHSLPQVENHTGSEESEASSLRTPEHRAEGLFRRRRTVSADGDNSERMTPRQARGDVLQSSGLSVQDALVLAGSSNMVGFRVALDERYDLLERSVVAQEHHNRLLAWDLQRRSQGLAMKQEHLHLQYESNTIMRENVDLSRRRAEFKENELQDCKLNLAYSEFSRACADQLVAGLCVMLVVLGFSFWQFSYDRLSGVVTVCRPPDRETNHQGGWLGTNWMYNNLNAFTYQLQAFICEVTKAGRMIVGLVIIAFVTSSLLRRSVTTSSQAMPATIIVIVLGGICGFAGKFSIDSLGGSGLHWLILWECLCFTHAFATCFTPLLYHLLNGSPARNYFETLPLTSRISSAVARFTFYAVLVFFLPLMAGLLPFASPEEIMQLVLNWWSPGTFRGRYSRVY